jgi:hypothetical protein
MTFNHWVVCSIKKRCKPLSISDFKKICPPKKIVLLALHLHFFCGPHPKMNLRDMFCSSSGTFAY